LLFLLFMEKKLTNSGLFGESTRKHRIYPRVVVIGRGFCLPARGAALRTHARGAQLWDYAMPVPDHTAVRTLATGEDAGRYRVTAGWRIEGDEERVSP